MGPKTGWFWGKLNSKGFYMKMDQNWFMNRCRLIRFWLGLCSRLNQQFYVFVENWSKWTKIGQNLEKSTCKKLVFISWFKKAIFTSEIHFLKSNLFFVLERFRLTIGQFCQKWQKWLFSWVNFDIERKFSQIGWFLAKIKCAS